MNEEVFQKIAKFISESNDTPEENITMDSTFEELDMDSLDGLALVDYLEKEYKISIANEEILKIRSVRETVEKLEPLLIKKLL